MQLSDMKKTLFGFRAEDVYGYLDEVGREYSEKLKSSAEAYEKRIAEMEAQNASLQAAILELQEENKKYRTDKSAVADALIDAKALAAKLKLDTEAQANEQRQKLKEEFNEGKRILEEVFDGVTACKQTVIAQLESLKNTLEVTEQEIRSEIDKKTEFAEQYQNTDTFSLFTLNKGE